MVYNHLGNREASQGPQSEPQINACTPFFCGIFALSATSAVLVTFLTAKRAKVRKGDPQRNA